VYDPSKIYLLLVDDDLDFRGSVARRFLRRGYQVQEASSGPEALSLCERRQFDLVILDLVMPGVTGIEVLEKLKAAHAECEVIMLTGQGTIEIGSADRKGLRAEKLAQGKSTASGRP
jgi:DNA-binding response OmpR family regulator